MGIECIECPHERVIGKDRRVLGVQQQGKAIGLVAIKAVITAQGEIEPEDQAISKPSRQARGSFSGWF